MSTLNGQKMLGYGVAGSILLVLADVAPRLAVGTAGLILLATVLTHGEQLTTLAGWISQSTGTIAANTSAPPIINPPGRRPLL